MTVKRINGKATYPYGTTRAVANKLGLACSLVSNVLRHNKPSRHTAEILEATADYLSDVQKKEQEARERLNAVISQTQLQA